MNMEYLGYDNFFRNQIKTNSQMDLEPGRITAVNRDNFLARNQYGECVAELTGKLIYTIENSLERPAVGDWVLMQCFNDNTFAVIHKILERKSLLKRKVAGNKTDFQLLAANIDAAFIIQATDYNINRLERYLVMVRDGGIEPVVLLGKSDLFGIDELNHRYEEIRTLQGNPEVITFSNLSGSGIQEIRERLRSQETYCLLGMSGVGKTTLINTLIGSESYAVQNVREKDGKGKHTTTRRELIILDNGSMIVDTPGMRELGNFDVTEGMSETFKDIETLAQSCRFSDCTHIHEKDCAVLAALEAGEIDHKHYKNYLKLQRESDYLERSYLEKRKRDKEFGKMLKNVMKNNRKE